MTWSTWRMQTLDEDNWDSEVFSCLPLLVVYEIHWNKWTFFVLLLPRGWVQKNYAFNYTKWFVKTRYLIDSCTPVSEVAGRWQLRPASWQPLSVPPHVWLSMIGCRFFLSVVELHGTRLYWIVFVIQHWVLTALGNYLNWNYLWVQRRCLLTHGWLFWCLFRQSSKSHCKNISVLL